MSSPLVFYLFIRGLRLSISDDQRRYVSERRNCLASLSVGLARGVPRLDRVCSACNQLPRLERGGARLRKTNFGITAEPHFAGATSEHESQDPFPRPCRRDDELQSVTVAVLASFRRFDLARGKLAHIASFPVHKSVHKFQ